MSYGEFLALFLGIPLVACFVMLRGHVTRGVILLLVGISVLATLYTAPWDNLIVIEGVWSYGPHQVLGPVIGHVPLEEYAFYVLQVFLTGLLTVSLLRVGRNGTCSDT